MKVEDVLVGEVWLLSGQSNMGGPLLMSVGGEEAAATADFPTSACSIPTPAPTDGFVASAG